MASAHSARLASRSTWNAVCSIGVERPVPHSMRPCERMSAVATFSATRAGCVNPYGSSVTPKPRRMFSVAWVSAPITTSGAGQCERPSRKWCSTNHAMWKPSSSARLHLVEHLGVGPLLALRAGRTGAARRPTVGARRSRTAGPASRRTLPACYHICDRLTRYRDIVRRGAVPSSTPSGGESGMSSRKSNSVLRAAARALHLLADDPSSGMVARRHRRAKPT